MDTNTPDILFKAGRRVFAVNITAKENGTVEPNDVFSKLDNHAKVVAVCLTSNQLAKVYYRGAVSLEVGGKEVFPKEFEAKMLLFELAVAPEERWITIDRDINGKVEIAYKDTDSPEAPFEQPYTLTMYFLCEK